MSAPSGRNRLAAFVAGTLLTQLVNSALHLAQPLLMAEKTGSLGLAALFSSFDTAVHMLGTFCGGWPVDRFGARRVLLASTIARGGALFAIPILLAAGNLTPEAAAAWYTLDAFARGFVDAAIYSLPLELAEHDAEALDRWNSRYELAFDAGGIAGPLALGGMMLWLPSIVAHAAIPAGFVVSALAYSFVPENTRRKASPKGGTWQGFRAITTVPGLGWVCAAYVSFNLFPLRKLLSAFFAQAILRAPAAAGLLGSAFAAGGLAGSLFYARWSRRVPRGAWIGGGACGLILLAIGWIPGTLGAMAASAFVFALSNAAVRLSLTRARQELTPLSQLGGVTSAARFGANVVSVGAKSLLAVAFGAGAGPAAAFAVVGASLVALALAQLGLARKLSFREAGAAAS